jgi:hypothetical protein
METYPVDVEVEQVVRWLIDEQRSGKHELEVVASRSYLLESISSSQRQRQRLGDDEAEDLTEVTAVGVLEVSPLHKQEGWMLRVRIDDALGPRLPESVPASDEPEEIDLADFQQDFIVPGSGTAFVSVDAETPEAFSLCQTLLAEIEANRHAS